MTPILVTPPTADVVSLSDMKAHLRVTAADEDGVIAALTAAAVAYLDGWDGVLGRCIGEQVWRVTADAAGDVVLPMPNVSAASAGYEAGATALDITATAGGPLVTVTEASDITITCAMPGHMLPAVQMAVKLLVAHWYENRASVAVGMAANEVPLGFDMLISAMRWRQV